jgi:hypothetical protein
VSDDASDILPDSAFQAPAPVLPPSAVDDVIPHEALSPWYTVIGHGLEDTAGSIAHGAGTLIDVGRNDVRAFQGKPTLDYGGPESTGAYLSRPFDHAPNVVAPSTDPKEAIRRGLPKLGDQPFVKNALNTPAGQTLTGDVLYPAADIAQAATSVYGAGKAVSGLMAPATAEAVAAPAATSSKAAFDSQPIEGGLPPEMSTDRAKVLQRVGVDNARNSALTGNAKDAATDYQLSKFDEPAGVAAKAQFDAEKAVLNKHATGIVNETGGTLGTDEDTLHSRGQTIAAPFDKLRQYFDTQKDVAYKAAGERAAGAPIGSLENTSNLLKDPDFTETLLAKDQGGLLQSVQRQFQRFQALNPDGMTVENAENFRKWMNQVWTPDNSATLGKVKGALDEDVLKGAGEDIYGPARKIVQTEAQTLDNPKGVSKLMDFDPKNPLNRTTPYAKIPDALTRLDPSQFDNVIKTLDTMPEAIQPEAQAAKAEIKAHLANKVLDAGSSTQGQWNAPGVSKVIKANSAKLQSAFADQPETLAKIQDLDSAGKILKVDQSYPGAAAQAANVLKRGAMSNVVSKGLAAAGGSIGGTAGAIVGGPAAGVAGASAGAALGGSIGGKAAQNMAERSALKKWQSGTTKLSDLLKPRP